MSKNLIIGILSVFVVIVCMLNYRNVRNLSASNKTHSQTSSLYNEIVFLERSLDYAMTKNENRFNVGPMVSIVLYYSNQSCSTCVEDFLLNFKNTPGIQQELLVIVDEELKKEVIIGFNDSFGTTYNYLVDTSKYFKEPIDDVLIIKMEDQSVQYILEYRPENHEIFNQYFVSKEYLKNKIMNFN